jgi:hypothetical protein
MHASAARIVRGRETLRFIINESHGEPRGTGDAPKAMVARSTSDRTAANFSSYLSPVAPGKHPLSPAAAARLREKMRHRPFYGPEADEKKMPLGLALLFVWIPLSLAAWALILAPIVWLIR